MLNTTTNHSRLTLVSALADGKPSIVAEVLIKQGRELKEVRDFSSTMSKAVQHATRWFKEETKRVEEEKKQRESLMTEQARAERLIQARAQEGINAAKETFLQTLIAGGMTKAQAQEMVESEFSHVYPMGKVMIQFRGKKFETSLKGKANADLKQALAATGMNRRQFIDTFAVQ